MIQKIVSVFFCLAITLVTAQAQSNYAVVRGSILDPQHRPIANARVHITASGTGTEREVTSNATGLYEIAGLQPGAYTLTVDSPGFKQATQVLNLEVGQQATLDLELRLGSDTQTVTVKAVGELLMTQDASVGEVVDQRSVDSLPLNGRMLIDLVLTVPGAHLSHGASSGDMSSLYWRPGQRSAVSIGGSRPNANYFLLDGATNTDPTFSTQARSQLQARLDQAEAKLGALRTTHQQTIRSGRLATITVTFTTGDLPKIAAKPSRIHKALNRAWDGLSSEISWAAIALIVASPFLLLAALLALLVRSRRRREERRLLEQ